MSAGNYPTIVSAYAGDRFYHDAADRLRRDCERLELPHRIVQWEFRAGDTWITLCRRKVAFYRQMLEEHPGGIFWIDVDSRIISQPTFLRGLNCDFGAFLREFQYLKDFNSGALRRTFVPAFLYFGPTQRAIEFLSTMEELERSSTEYATDDYFLHEAWLAFKKQMVVTIFPPALLQRPGDPLTEEVRLSVGISGQAKPASKVAKQHEPPPVSLAEKLTVLRALSEEANNRGDMDKRQVFLSAILDETPADQSTATRLAKASKHPERIGRAREILAKVRPFWTPPFKALDTWLHVELLMGNTKEARALCEELAASEHAGDRAIAKSRLYRIELDERADALGVARNTRRKLWWMETPFPGNFGDVLSPYIIEKLSGIPPVMAPVGIGALAIGSTIKFAQAGTSVWGTGTPRMTDVLSPDAKYLAVRGPYTRKLVLESGGSVPEIYGDPAWYLPEIFNPVVPKTHKLGLIRHLVHRDRPVQLKGVQEIGLSRVGDVEIERFIEEVLSCEKIISTSLHGLIVAHAYGIPAEWATFADGGAGLAGDETKFWDYFASVGIREHSPLDLSQFAEITEALAREVSRLPARGIDLQALSAVAPFRVSQASPESTDGGAR